MAKKRYYILLAIFLSALVVRLVYVAEIHANSPFSQVVFVDALTYHGSALEVLGEVPAGEFSHSAYYQPPLYPYFLALVYKVFSVSFASARIIQAILGALSCVLIFLIAQRYFSFKAAVLAGFAAVFYRNFIFFDGEVLTTTLGMFLGLAGLHSAGIAFARDTTETKRKYLWACVAGLSFGLMAITVPNILLFALFLTVYVILDKRIESRFLVLACFLIPFVLPIGITAVRNYAVSNDSVLISSNGGLNFYIGNNLRSEETIRYRPGSPEWTDLVHMPFSEARKQEMPRSEWSRYYYTKSLTYIFSHPLHYLGAQARKVVRFFNHIEYQRNLDFYYLMSFSGILSYNFVTYLLVCPLALLGLIVFFKNRRELLLLYVFFTLYFLSVTGFFVAGRYRIPVIPVMVVFASGAVFELIAAAGCRKKLLVYLGILAALFVFVSVDWIGDYVPPEENAENFVFAGNAYFAGGEAERARQSYEKATELDPDNAEARRKFGCFLTAQGDFEKAEKELERAVGLNPEYHAPYLALAELREKQKDYKGAVEALHEAVRRGKMKNTTWVVVFLALGRIHFNLGEFDKAEAAFRNALLIYPRNAEVLTCLGALYGAANRLEEATTVLKSAISYAPHYEKAYNDLLFVYIIRRDAAAIRKILGKATAEGISLNPHLLQKSSQIIKSK